MLLNLSLEKDFRVWLDFLNEIRSIGVDDDFGIPQIAVIGDQSSGKSSLLSSLSGIPFPRGSGLVTRMPIIITLQTKSRDRTTSDQDEWEAETSVVLNSNRDKSGVNEVGIDSEYPGSGRVYSPDALAQNLSKLMQLLTKNSKNGFSSDTILVKVSSFNVPNLILVDLPGIVRTTTVGQSINVISEIDEILNSFMRQPRTIILAVIPANQDIATVDVLERAQRFDPKGMRTIGVITKVDLVESTAEGEVSGVFIW